MPSSDPRSEPLPKSLIGLITHIGRVLGPQAMECVANAVQSVEAEHKRVVAAKDEVISRYEAELTDRGAPLDQQCRLPMRVRCDEEVTRALMTERRGGGLAFFFWDFFRFRWYNNRDRDHQLGDTVLRCHGDILRTCIRQNSHVFRFGGDEFLALAPDEDSLDAALAVASRIEDAIRRYPWIGTDHRLGDHLPRVNMGVLYIPIPAEVERLAMRDTPGLVDRLRQDLYKILDLLMYGAKADMERGESRVHSRIGHIANGLILDEQSRDLRRQLEQQIGRERSEF